MLIGFRWIDWSYDFMLRIVKWVFDELCVGLILVIPFMRSVLQMQRISRKMVYSLNLRKPSKRNFRGKKTVGWHVKMVWSASFLFRYLGLFPSCSCWRPSSVVVHSLFTVSRVCFIRFFNGDFFLLLAAYGSFSVAEVFSDKLLSW